MSKDYKVKYKATAWVTADSLEEARELFYDDVVYDEEIETEDWYENGKLVR